MTALFISSTLLLGSACTNDGNDSEAAPRETPEAIETSTAEPSAVNEAGKLRNSIPTEKEPASDAHGLYLQTTIYPDDPGFSYDASLISAEAAARFSPEQIDEAHRIAVEYAVDAIDSPMNGSAGDPTVTEAWWAANQDRFHPIYREDMHTAATSADPNLPIVYKGTHRDSRGYGLQYGPSVAHIADRNIETTEILSGDLNGAPAIAVSLQITYTNAVSIDGKNALEPATAVIRITMAADESTGKLLITGLSGTYTTTPLR